MAEAGRKIYVLDKDIYESIQGGVKVPNIATQCLGLSRGGSN